MNINRKKILVIIIIASILLMSYYHFVIRVDNEKELETNIRLGCWEAAYQKDVLKHISENQYKECLERMKF